MQVVWCRHGSLLHILCILVCSCFGQKLQRPVEGRKELTGSLHWLVLHWPWPVVEHRVCAGLHCWPERVLCAAELLQVLHRIKECHPSQDEMLSRVKSPTQAAQKISCTRS